MGGDFELTRQDGRDMALSELGMNQYWITFMEPTCQACPAELARVHQLGLAGLMVVISADRTWIRPSWAVGFSEARLMRCPLVATAVIWLESLRVIGCRPCPRNKAWTTPFGGINPKPMAS